MSQATVSVSWNADRFAPMTDTWFYDAEGDARGNVWSFYRIVCIYIYIYIHIIYIYIDIGEDRENFLSSFFS